MRMDLPAPVLHSLFALNEAGYEAFVVGGCVRDTLMGKAPFDWDITTSALPEQMQRVFCEYRTIETGIQHGTLTVIIDDLPLEITTYRVDGTYTDGRHPDAVSFTASLTEDLRRRDFTVNAMAYHPQIGLVDPFGGRQDLTDGMIRAVGEPKTRFTEDSLRILRGLRFSSTLGFAIDPATSEAIFALSRSLNRVSAERITTELTKLLCGQWADRILQNYGDVLSAVLPYPLDFSLVARCIVKTQPLPLYRYATLLFGLSEEQLVETAEKLRFSRRLTEDLRKMIQHKHLPIHGNQSNILHLLNQLGAELAPVFLTVRSLYDQTDYSDCIRLMQKLTESGACYRISDLAVTGNDLLEIGVRPGPNIGSTLAALLDAVMEGACPNEKEDLLELATKKPVQ